MKFRMNYLRITIFSCLLLIAFSSLQAQKSDEAQYRVACIGFYNLENFFDTIVDPDTNKVLQDDFTPEGSKLWNAEKYQEKLHNMSRVISELGTEMTPDGAAILGLCELENRTVLEDLVAMPALKDRNYQIVHEESLDERGIDVGLLYNPKYFKEISHELLPVMFPRTDEPVEKFIGTYNRKKVDYSRGVLWVKGIFGGMDTLHVFVNHWPSRSGGEAQSSPKRQHAAKQVKQVVDSLMKIDPNTKVFITGDLNDDPISPSVRDVLQAKRKPNQVKPGQLYNPMWDKYRQGDGTLTWNSAWNLFDQTIISSGFLDKKQDGYFFYSAVVYRKPYLLQKDGRFKGSPFRTYSFGDYIGGYSDHLPVYAFFLQRIEE